MVVGGLLAGTSHAGGPSRHYHRQYPTWCLQKKNETNFMNNLSHWLKCSEGCLRGHRLTATFKLEARPSIHASQRTKRPFGEGVVDLAGPRQASGGGEHTGAVEPAGGVGRRRGARHHVTRGLRCGSHA